MATRCPQCKKALAPQERAPAVQEAKEAKKTLPFCSERCRLLDLDSWLTGRYALPAVDQETESDDESLDS